MLELLDFGQITASTIQFELRDKILLVMPCKKIMISSKLQPCLLKQH